MGIEGSLRGDLEECLLLRMSRQAFMSSLGLSFRSETSTSSEFLRRTVSAGCSTFLMRVTKAQVQDMLKCCYKLKVVNILSQSITASLSIQLIKTQATKSGGMGQGIRRMWGQIITLILLMLEEIKMARHASLKERDFQRNPTPTLSHSLSISLKKTQRSTEMPEDNSSSALRQLKKINDYKEMLKGRLSALQILQEKNENRAFRNQHKYEFHMQVQEDILAGKQKKAQLREKKQRELSDIKEKARLEREERLANLKNAQKQLSKCRVMDYKQVKEKRAEIQRTISETKRMEAEANRAKSLNVREYEKSQKNNVEEYLKIKRKEVQKEDRSSAADVLRTKQAKRKEIQQLSRLQQLMIEKQGKSRMTRQQSQTRLSKLIGGRISSSRVTKLPSIRAHASQQDLITL